RGRVGYRGAWRHAQYDPHCPHRGKPGLSPEREHTSVGCRRIGHVWPWRSFAALDTAGGLGRGGPDQSAVVLGSAYSFHSCDLLSSAALAPYSESSHRRSAGHGRSTVLHASRWKTGAADRTTGDRAV